MAVRRIHHDGIDSCFDERLDTFFRALADTHRRAHTQAAEASRAALGKLVCLVMSFTVIRPLSSKASFTTRMRSSLCLLSSALASAGVVPFVDGNELFAWRQRSGAP